jgi:hypothetical protein
VELRLGTLDANTGFMIHVPYISTYAVFVDSKANKERKGKKREEKAKD